MTYLVPDTLSDALDALSMSCGTIVAGGTDVYPSGQVRPGGGPFLDITRIRGLGDVSPREGGTHIGAAVTWSDLIATDLPPAFDALKAAGREVGSVQIQNAGTIVGNLCNASPAADGVPPLLALNAHVELASAARGARQLPLDQFITGVRQTERAEDEIVTGIFIPAQPEGMRSAFEKLGARRYLVISISMTAVNLCLADGRIAEARIAVGACSAVARRLGGLEGDLVGRAVGEVEIRDDHLADLSPIDDVRGTGAFRLEAVREQILRAIRRAAE